MRYCDRKVAHSNHWGWVAAGLCLVRKCLPTRCRSPDITQLQVSGTEGETWEVEGRDMGGRRHIQRRIGSQTQDRVGVDEERTRQVSSKTGD